MISITIEGEEGISLMLDTLSEALLHPPIQAGLEVISESVLENFAKGGRPPWPDILPSSRAQRKFDKGTPPLWDSGEMAAAATATTPGVGHSTYGIAADGISGQIGVDDLFHGARRHQFGFGVDKLGRHFDEPARAFMVFHDGDAAKVVEVFDMWIKTTIDAVK